MAVVNKPFKIGKYDVVEHLGGGGMGDVYKAVDPRIGRTVAIKVIKVDFAQDPELLRRFDIEAKAVGNLQHPNIVAVYEFGEENGSPYLVMPYLDGTPLDKIIAQRQNLEVIQKLDIIIGVLKALDYAHEHGVIHRDVKPANVQVLKDESVKLLDFGIAREGDVSLTQTKQVLGTLLYMPPEQMNMEVVDRRGDIFSTGIVLFELLTYRLPFEARDQASIIVQRLKGDPPPPLSKYLDNYPPELDDIVARAMMRDREERYSRAEDFAFDLTRAQERLKRERASQYVDQARALIAKSDLVKAKDLLSEVIRIDTQNSTAKQLHYEVQQRLQAQQRVERIQRLRTQAEEALAAKQLQNATDLVEQAIKIDQNDLDLLDLHEKIREAKARGEQVLGLLKSASAAQQMEQFELAQKAVADALALDASDTDAKVMQAAIARQLAAHEKRNRVHQLLQVARREIAARQYDAARENISKAKAVDPAHPEIPGLEKMVVAGQQQERRHVELQQVCAEIEQRLVDNNLAAARDLAGNSLRKFPGEERLMRLRAAADEAYEQEERRLYIEQELISASRLVDDGQASAALKLLKDAERVYPTDTRLQEYLKVVREAATRESAEREKKGILIRAGAAIRRKSFLEAISTLEGGLVQFPADSEMRELLETARQEADRLNQKRHLEEVGKQAQDLLNLRKHTDAIRLLERTSAQFPDPDLLRLLEYARKEAAGYRTGLQNANHQATQLLNSGQYSEALKFLERKEATYARNAEFQDLLTQARTRIGESQLARQRLQGALVDARARITAGDLLAAEALLQSCQAEFPSEPEVLLLLGQIREAKQAQARQAQDKAFKVAEVDERLPDTRLFTTAASEAQATAIFPPEIDLGKSAPPTPSFDELGSQSQATDMFTAPDALDLQQPSPTGQLVGTEAESPRVSPKGKKSRKKTKDFESGPEPYTTNFPGAVLEEPVIEPPRPPAPEPGWNKRLVLMAIAGLILLVVVVVAIIRFTGGGTEAYLTVTATSGGRPVSGAELFVDGKSVGTVTADGTITAKIDPGNRGLKVTAKGYDTWTDTATISAGQRKSIPADLKPISVERGTVMVKSKDAGAEVFIDGKSSGFVGRDRKLSVEVDTGTHRLQLKKSGYQGSPEKTVDVAANGTFPVPFDSLVEIPGKTALVIDVIPRDASVRIDGRAADNSAKGPFKEKVDPGKHTVQVAKEGYETKTSEVYVEKDQEARVPVTLSPKALPSVLSFTANPPSIKKGDPAVLTWRTQKTTGISIDNGLGPVQSPEGNREVRPSDTTTYTLTATGPGGTEYKTVTVRVVMLEPTIGFGAVDSNIVKGRQTKLKWSVDNATEVSIDQGIGTVPAKGDRDVTPNDTTTYTLTAKWSGAPKTATTRVTVAAPIQQLQPIIEFKPTDATIQKGQSTELMWTVQYATEVFIDHGIGKVQASGEQPVNPLETTTYTLTANGPGGKKEESVKITVTLRPVSPEDLKAVFRKYAEAVKTHDADALRVIWPTIDKQRMALFTNKAVQSSIIEDCSGSPKTTQDGAEWTCNETLNAVANGISSIPVPNTFTFKFKRVGESWQIAGVAKK